MQHTTPGREIIERKSTHHLTITLAKVDGVSPYVTWASKSDSPDDTFWGHYFGDLEAAAADFKTRLNRGY